MKRGKKLGFPTANILLSFPIDEGIYISRVKLADIYFNALTFIGAAKTFGEETVQSETWIFDFDEDIYGQTLGITLIKKLRENAKFESEAKLIKQMNLDKSKAIKYFNDSS